MLEMFQLDFMRQAFIAAVLVGAAAPAVGVFLLQRRLSLIGDGLGHEDVGDPVVELAPDGVHPTPRGSALIADAWRTAASISDSR